jgi:hypothetical protein
MKAAMNVRVPKISAIPWITDRLLASQEGLCSVELLIWYLRSFPEFLNLTTSVSSKIMVTKCPPRDAMYNSG